MSRAGKEELPDSVYYQSYLRKCGVRFHYSFVDSTVQRGFTLSFYLIALLFIVLCLFGRHQPGLGSVSLTLILLSFIYLTLYAARYFYCCALRRRLRRQSPLLAEAYAVVLLDREIGLLPNALRTGRVKRAVLYKECGTLKPRFFLGAAARRPRHSLLPGLQVRVFIDYKNDRLYSVDEDSAVVTQPVRAGVLSSLNLNGTLSSGAEMRAPADECAAKGKRSA